MKNKSKKTNILLVTNSIEGGAGTFILSLLELKDYMSSVSVDALVFREPKYTNIKNYPSNIKFLSKNNYPIYYKISIHTLLLLIAELRGIKNEIVKKNPDIVISVDTHYNFLVILLKIFYFKKIKVIATNHVNLTVSSTKRLSILLRFLAKRVGNNLYKKADFLIGVSIGISQELKTYYSLKKEVITIHNGIDTHNKYTKELLTKNNEIITIITVCRFVEQKDFTTLLKAFYILKKEYKNVQLIIVGDGPLRDTVQKTTHEMGLKKNILFLGWKSNPIYYIKKADIFVLSSKWEGFPYAILEAMSVGIPVIATNSLYGPYEILQNNKYGILVPLADTTAMKNAFTYLIKNIDIYKHYSLQSRKRINSFSKKKMLMKYKKIIVKLKREL